MGCKQSRHSRVKHNGQIYNEDVDIRKKFLTGVHIAKGANGIEGNIQIALGTTRRKKYELVTPPEEPAVDDTQGDSGPSLRSGPSVPADPAVPSELRVPSVLEVMRRDEE